MPENGQEFLQMVTLLPAPPYYPLTPLPKITAALGALLAQFLPDLTDFQKQQLNGTGLRRQRQDQAAKTPAASQASPRLKHVCAYRRVLASRNSLPIDEGDLMFYKFLCCFVIFLQIQH